MEVTKQETLYHKDHGATLKHNCGKKDSSIVPFPFSFFIWPFGLSLSFYLAFLFLFGLSFIFLFGLYFFIWTFFFMAFLFFYWDNALLNDDHHTSIYLQLNYYNSILEQSMTLYECLRRCIGMGNESRVTCMK